MRKPLLFALTLSAFSACLDAQTVAQDWTHTDCVSGSSFNLFNMLDSSKVVVMEFEMGCSTCAIAAASLEGMKQNYDSSNPGQVKFFLMDYWSGHTCTNVNSFVSANSLTFGGFVGCAADKNYYTSGSPMPMIVVVGGPNHTVYYEKNSYVAADDPNITAAINQALSDIASGISQTLHLNLSVSLASNPVVSDLALNITTDKGERINVEVYNILGEHVFSQKVEVKEKGAQMVKLDSPDLKNGIYFLRYSVGALRKTIKFIVSK